MTVKQLASRAGTARMAALSPIERQALASLAARTRMASLTPEQRRAATAAATAKRRENCKVRKEKRQSSQLVGT